LFQVIEEVLNNLEDVERMTIYLVSISSTFYEQLFHTQIPKV